MKMVPGPVYLRLCTDELKIVSWHWWDKFLLSQEKAIGGVKKDLTQSTSTGVSLDSRGTGTHGNVQQEIGRRAIQV